MTTSSVLVSAGRPIAWANPLTAGLAAVVLPAEIAKWPGGPYTTVGGVTVGAAPPFDRAIDFSAGSCYLEFGTVTDYTLPIGVVTQIIPVNATNQAFAGFGGAGGGHGWKIGQGSNNATDLLFTLGGVADYAFAGFFVAGDFGTPVTVGVSVDKNNGTASAYKNGAFFGSVAIGTILAPTKPFRVGASYNASIDGDFFRGRTAYCYLWHRALSAVEHEQIARTPQRIFAKSRVLYVPVSSGISATASGSLALAGSATGTALVHGTASGALALAGTATSTALVQASAAGALALGGTSTGTALVQATASGSLALAGSASGTATVQATATGALALAGSASGTILVTASASGAFQLAGTAQGVIGAVVTGTATGTFALAGSGAGVVLVSASSAGALALTGSAAGTVTIVATASGALALGGTATGTMALHASATGSLTLAGTSQGLVVIAATAAGVLLVQGSATATVITGRPPSYVTTTVISPRYATTTVIAPHWSAVTVIRPRYPTTTILS